MKSFSPSRLVFVLCVASSLTACDPIESIDLRIVDARGAPIDHVRVTKSCPNVPAPTVTETGPDGVFRDDQIPSFDRKCTFEISKDGFRPQTLGPVQAGATKGANTKTPKDLALQRVP